MVRSKSWPHARYHVDGLTLSNGTYIYAGEALTLGKGTLPKGDFNYIATPSNSKEAKLKARTRLKTIRIEEIIKKFSKKYGNRFIVKGEENYLIQLEDAIATGEIMLDSQIPSK
jgi:hypothetical protein